MTDPIFSGFLYSDTLLYLVCNVIWTQMRIKGTCVCMRVVTVFLYASVRVYVFRPLHVPDFLSFDVLPDICQPWMMCTSCHTEVSWNDMTFLGHDGVHLCCFTPSMLWPPLICEAFGVAFPLLFYNTDIVQASILQVNRQLFIPSFTIHLCMNINLSQRPEPL